MTACRADGLSRIERTRRNRTAALEVRGRTASALLDEVGDDVGVGDLVLDGQQFVVDGHRF
ncbi:MULTISPECIES: hypothetical protein [Natrialbaceae]|uniref:hypothetical protein n=1 Tax=Natrialbaceae TaxID=1644061 RepID=UPI00207D67D4|nr:hypothetical protein [Natronococcus sp. CG52]